MTYSRGLGPSSDCQTLVDILENRAEQDPALPLFTFLTPGRFKSIRAEQIAQAMAVLGKEPPQSSQVYHYPEMMALITGSAA